MDNTRRGLSIVFIKADNEQKLQEKLFALELKTLKTPDVRAIYPKGSSVIAWVAIENKHLEYTPSKELPKKVSKKVTKKKTKKAVK
jgi:hypothetical protein